MESSRLDWALEEADIPVLLMVLLHLTGDQRWIEDPYRPRRDVRLFPDESGGLPEELQAEVRAAVAAALGARDIESGSIELSDDTYSKMMTVCVGEEVAPEYVQLLLEEMGIRPSMPAWPKVTEPVRRPNHVLIIGAGFSGLCAAIQLQQAGIDYTVVDRNPRLGGVWYENTYPDAGVDTPNHFYSYSFMPNLRWTSYFSKQAEVLEYIEACADRFDVRSHVQLGTEVIETRWIEDEQRWATTVRCGDTGDGDVEVLHSEAVIMAVGHLNQPSIPSFSGLDDFTGTVFHTARWRHDVDLRDKRVAMVGVGASAIQIARTVAAQAASFTVFQRSPQWVAPNPDYHRTVSDRKLWLLANVPHFAMWYRFVRFWRYGDGLLSALFKDPDWTHPERSVGPANDRHRRYYTDYLMQQLEGREDLVPKTLPTYPPFGKRMLVDNGWFTTLKRDNVDLVTHDIDRLTADGIVTADGVEHDVDVIIMATGFHARRYIWPIRAVGRIDLAEIWGEDDARAYLGITVPGMPNFFIMGGPNTSLAHGGSAIFHAECQVRYILSLLIQMAESGYGMADVKPEVLEQYVASVDERHEQMVWTHPGMSNWYRNARGRVVTTSPWRMVDYWAMTHEADLNDYELNARAVAQTSK